MIIKFKIFESLNQGEPKIGDWVICELMQNISEIIPDNETLDTFISSNIGRIVRYENLSDCHSYYVRYKTKIPYNIKKWFDVDIFKFDFAREEIKYWSKNKNELELIVAAKKYNL